MKNYLLRLRRNLSQKTRLVKIGIQEELYSSEPLLVPKRTAQEKDEKKCGESRKKKKKC
jgi:hypothetical protein